MTEVQLLKSIDEATQKISLKRIEGYSQTQGFTIQPELMSHIPLIDYSMVIILISGGALRQTFKVFFDLSHAKVLLKKIYKTEVKNPDELTCDFFKEIANLTAGQMRNLFEKSGFQCEISLPILLRAYDELFFNSKEDVNSKTSYWQIKNKEVTLYCSSTVELFEKSKNRSFLSEDEDGNIDFF